MRNQEVVRKPQHELVFRGAERRTEPLARKNGSTVDRAAGSRMQVDCGDARRPPIHALAGTEPRLLLWRSARDAA